MALLEIRDAAFTVLLEEGGRLAYAAPSARAACEAALTAAGLMRPQTGSVFIGAFDPRIQPVQAKRIVGYVPHDVFSRDFRSFNAYIEYRAALWGLSAARSVVRGRALLAQLDGVHEAFAFPLVGALLAQPRLLVLDRPQTAYAAQILHVAGASAVFSTHVSQRQAQRFSALELVRT